MSAREREIAHLLGMTDEEWEGLKRDLFEAGASPEEAAAHLHDAAQTRRKHKEGN